MVQNLTEGWFPVAYAFTTLYLGLDNLFLKGESKMVRQLGLHDTEQQNKMARINGILLLLAACTYPYQELIGWPPVIFGVYEWVNHGTQSTTLTAFILIIVWCIQRVFVKRDRINKE